MSYKSFYTHFLNGHGDKLHMACHSHHFWPDVTREATLKYWDDSAQSSDQKWNDIFGKKVPILQQTIAKHLKTSRPDHIVFSPNTHDLVIRLLSTLDLTKKPKILTTKGEFHSFSRQVKRLEEENLVDVIRIDSFPSEKFWHQYENATSNASFDLIFISHVFFNSGTSIGNLNKLIETKKDQGKIVIDGYHSYFAIPIDLSKIEDRVYFMAGHYKYAQSGEGLCFMCCPPGNDRPLITGWFAEFEALASKQGEVSYPTHGGRYLGSTMDFTPLYRAQSVYNLFEENKVSVNVIHEHVQKIQKKFLSIIDELNHSLLNRKNLLHDGFENQGHFLAFDLGSSEQCQKLESALKKIGILTDSRGSIFRFGFSLYQDEQDLERLRRIEKL